MLLKIDEEDDSQGNQSSRTNAEPDTNQDGVPLSIVMALGAPPAKTDTTPDGLETLQPLVDPLIPAREARQE